MKDVILKKLKDLTFTEEIKNGEFNFTLNLEELPYDCNPGVYLILLRFPENNLEFFENLSEEDTENWNSHILDIILQNIVYYTDYPLSIRFMLDLEGRESFLAYIYKEPLEPNKQEKIELLISEADKSFNELYKEEMK